MPDVLVAPVTAGAADWQRASTVGPVRLSRQQLRLLGFVYRFQQAHGKTPTYREIGAAVFLARSAVAYQVARLRQLGVIEKRAYQPRAIRLTGIPVSLDAGQ